MKRSLYRANDRAFGESILALRVAIGLTQAELGDILGLSRRAIGSWEGGQTYPKAHHLKQLTEMLVEQGAFATENQAEEIRALWHAAGQQMLLDEAWLQALLQKQQVPPSSMPVVHVPHNLVKPLTALVGRAPELDVITGYLSVSDRRLITIVGVGGVGKTRLALEVAWVVFTGQASRFFRDGVYFVSFADVDIQEDDTNAVDVFATVVADAVRFVLSGSDRPYQQVLRYLRTQDLLLVLDNLEHVPHLTPTILALLQQSPSLTILATSIARLDVRGEQVVTLDGLPYQTGITSPTPGEAPAALQLFQRLASFHAPHLEWSPDETAAATAICTRVEGMPLAIELAASLVRVLSIQEIAAELVTSNMVLQTSQRDLSPRHRSLRAVFDHSWRLLTSLEQRVLANLSIFRGGFDRHAARAIAKAELPAIAALINRSLVREAARDDRTTRYTLHTLVREYAAAMLQARDDDADTDVANQHSRYYLDWVAARLPDLRGERQRTAQAEVHRDIDNIRAAWRHAAARSDIAALVAAGRALFHFYEMRSWFQEGAELFQLAVTCCEPLAVGDETMTRAWAQLLARQGWLTFHLGQSDTAQKLLAHSLALLEPFDAPQERAFTLNYLAAVTYHTGGYAAAERLAHEALACSDRVDDKHGIVIAKTILGQITYLTGAYVEARRWSLESLALEQTLGNRWGTVFTLISLGRVAVALEAYGDARRWFEEGLAIREQMGDARGSGLCLTYLGDVAAALGEYSEANRQYQAGLSRFQQIHNSAGMASVLTKLAAVALATQDQQRARGLLHEALAVSWSIQALPTTLDALAVLARVLVHDDPARAAELAALVVRHSAATQTSKRQAAQVWGRLASHYPTSNQDPQSMLSMLMTQLLATGTLLEDRHTSGSVHAKQ